MNTGDNGGYAWLDRRMVDDVRCIHGQAITDWCGTCEHESGIAFGPEGQPLAEVAEQVLRDEWHRDQCGCTAWPEACLYAHCAPTSFTVEAVLYAVEQAGRRG